MSELREFTVAVPRPLPVLLLVDISGSMREAGKIQALNRAVAEMMVSLAQEDDLRAQIQVAVVTFGLGGARVHLPLAPVVQAVWNDLTAEGKTPLGAALSILLELLEDRERIPSRAYRPTIVLVSDGQPTDEWQAPLQRLLDSERGSKAVRLAMAIGADADLSILGAFISDPKLSVFRADEARQIRQFFRWVTMSVSVRSRSVSPDKARLVPPEEWEDIDF